jgi:hypothetical protein
LCECDCKHILACLKIKPLESLTKGGKVIKVGKDDTERVPALLPHFEPENESLVIPRDVLSWIFFFLLKISSAAGIYSPGPEKTPCDRVSKIGEQTLARKEKRG